MENIIKRIIRWAWKDKVVVYSSRRVVSDFESLYGGTHNMEYIREKMAREIGIGLFEDGFIEFEMRKSLSSNSAVAVARITCIK